MPSEILKLNYIYDQCVQEEKSSVGLMAPTSAGQQMNQNNRDLWAVRRNTSNSHKLSLAISCCIHQTSCVAATSYFNSKFMQNVCLCQQCFNGRMDGILVAESIFVETPARMLWIWQ